MNETVIKKAFAAVLALCAVQLFALTSADASASAAIAIPGIVRMQAYLAGPDKKKFTYTDRSGKSASNVELTEVFPLNFKPYSKQQHQEAKT